MLFLSSTAGVSKMRPVGTFYMRAALVSDCIVHSSSKPKLRSCDGATVFSRYLRSSLCVDVLKEDMSERKPSQSSVFCFKP